MLLFYYRPGLLDFINKSWIFPHHVYAKELPMAIRPLFYEFEKRIYSEKVLPSSVVIANPLKKFVKLEVAKNVVKRK